jgi:phosphoglycolate phosphatase-like HAD superfamily hydrolase
MVEEWGLERWRDELLRSWNQVNLYTLTRGINRFKGLATALKEVDEKYMPVDGADAFFEWAESSKELSNGALEREIGKRPQEKIFAKALAWSKAVNLRIKALPEERLVPFAGVKKALERAHEYADIAVVSSANLEAVQEEWGKHGLLQSVDAVCAQHHGSKAYCIGELLKKGYEKDKVVMCGDALGDQAAAEINGVHFYPILVMKEKESWKEFLSTGLGLLLKGEFGGAYEQAKRKEFIENLGG